MSGGGGGAVKFEFEFVFEFVAADLTPVFAVVVTGAAGVDKEAGVDEFRGARYC